MTEKFKRVDYQDIAPRLGSSCMPEDLPYFTPEENAFRMEVREFAIKEILPYADQIDAAQDKKLTTQIGKKAAAAGYSNQMIPREWGGGGRNCTAELIAMEELAAPGWVAPAHLVPTCTFLAMPIYMHGTEEQKKNVMMGLLKGKYVGGMGMTEPAAGSNVAGTETTAVKDGSDWVLNGQKRFIGNGSQADFLLMYALTDPEAKTSRRLTAFILDTKTPGFSVVKDFPLMGMGGMALSWLKLENVRIPDSMRLGQAGQGFQVAMNELDPERAAAGGLFIGPMRTAYEIAAKYATERQQFGTAIGNHQAIGFRLSDMFIKIETSRLLAWRCAKTVDQHKPATKESSALKLYSSECCKEVLREALQIVGGIAYTKDYPIERFIRDAEVYTLFGGTSEMQRMIISRAILGQAARWTK
ncbi:MAG: acyl-CoA dehydrogenase [Chloroflexi bacterium]|nr:acyl-CoA dehydrogenase [Chloroflexota bacterium]